jgi:hypothetical protein
VRLWSEIVTLTLTLILSRRGRGDCMFEYLRANNYNYP